MDEWLVLRCSEPGWDLNPEQSSGHGEKLWFDRHLRAESAKLERAEGQGVVRSDVQVSSLEAWEDPGIIREEWFGEKGDGVHIGHGAWERGLWRESPGGSWGDEPWSGLGARSGCVETLGRSVWTQNRGLEGSSQRRQGNRGPWRQKSQEDFEHCHVGSVHKSLQVVCLGQPMRRGTGRRFSAGSGP